MMKAHVQDVASMGRPVKISALIARAWSRALAARGPRPPYRVGDAVVGDDPFNGRNEGIVMSYRGPSVEVGAAAGVFYYDHRHLRPQD
ncbi:MAG: hypothetical protein NVS2B15_07000 [Pseudarthrobacter sp.]